MTIIKRIFERFVYGAGFGFGMCIPYKLIGRNENIPPAPPPALPGEPAPPRRPKRATRAGG